MIAVYEGDQGACKTTMAVRRAIRLADGPRQRARIFSLFPIDHDRAEVVDWTFMLDPGCPPGIYVWDEAARATDSRRSMSLPPSVTNNFTEHRKHVRDVLITTQIFGMIDARLRGQCQERHLLRGKWYTKRRYGADVDGTEIVVQREHPRLVVRESWRGRHCQKGAPDHRARFVMPWSMLAPYARRFDTSATVNLAAHIAAGKDFYRDGGTDARGTDRAASRGPREAGAARPVPRADPRDLDPAPAPAPLLLPRSTTPGGRHAR